MNTLKPRIASLLQQLNERVFEKEHIVALALLSAVAGESIFLLGPPGVRGEKRSVSICGRSENE